MRRTTPVIAVAATLVMAASTVVFAASLVVVSGPSPYAGCATDSQPGTNFLNAEEEPFVAVNPATLGSKHVNLVGAFQQDRWSNGGARGLVAGFSFNGGATWGETPLPFDNCAPGAPATVQVFNRASDPWVAAGPDGIVYATAISINSLTNDNAVMAATSADGGQTWGNVNRVIFDKGTSTIFVTGTEFFNDKEAVTADPVKPATAYIVWDRLVAPNDNPDADAHTFALEGPAMFSKTVNGGQTWSAPAVIVNVGENADTIGNIIVVDPRTGTLFDFFDLQTNHFGVRGNKVAFVKSTDGGATWTAPQIISKLGTVFVEDPNTRQPIRTEDILPNPTIDPATGQLYVVWQDARFSGGKFDQVAISTSTDGGDTWSTPVRVNTPEGQPAFTPTVRVGSDGTVAVTYYDFRQLTPDNTTTLPTDYWIKKFAPAQAASGGIDTTVPDTHVSGPFNMLAAPFARGFFVGDYEGMAVVGTQFHPFFVQVNAACNSAPLTSTCLANRTDVFTGSF